MSYRFMDGKPVTHGPVPGAPVEPYAPTAPVLVQHGAYHCSSCGNMLQFEPLSQGEMANARFAVGACMNGHDCGDPECELNASTCRLWKVRLKVPLERIYCEIVS